MRERKYLPLVQVVQADLGFHVPQGDPGRGANKNSTSNYCGVNLRWQIITLGQSSLCGLTKCHENCKVENQNMSSIVVVKKTKTRNFIHSQTRCCTCSLVSTFDALLLSDLYKIPKMPC